MEYLLCARCYAKHFMHTCYFIFTIILQVRKYSCRDMAALDSNQICLTQKSIL